MNQAPGSNPPGAESPETHAVFQLAYDQIRRLARHVRRERPSDTLSTTALVNEAFIKVCDHFGSGADAEHIKAVTVRAMRHILVDHVRRRSAEKRGGGQAAVTLDDLIDEGQSHGLDLVAVDAALRGLETISPRLATVVEMHVFAGFDMQEIATQLGIAERTAFRDWRKARAYLLTQLA
jgi:RNA polymerase sigma factor (TIGR02999 family)